MNNATFGFQTFNIGATTKVQVLHFKLYNSNNTHGEEGRPYFWLVCNWKHQPRPWNDAIQGMRI